METTYGKGKYCPAQTWWQVPETLDDLSHTLGKLAQNYDELLDAWQGWHDQAKTLRGAYSRYVTLANKGAKDFGYPDVGTLWRSKYDMPPRGLFPPMSSACGRRCSRCISPCTAIRAP